MVTVTIRLDGKFSEHADKHLRVQKAVDLAYGQGGFNHNQLVERRPTNCGGCCLVYFHVSQFCQLSKLCSSKTSGGVTPTNAMSSLSRLSTLIQRKSELHSPLRFGVTTAQTTFLQVMLITLRV